MSSPQMLQSAPSAPPLLAAAAMPGADEPVQRASDCLRFVSGEWLIDESWRDSPRNGSQLPRWRHQLYFQHSASAPCEAMGEVAAPGAAQPLLFRSGQRCAIVLGHYVFQRWQLPQGPYWYRVTTQPFGAAAFFLRAYLRERDADAMPGQGLSVPEVPYAFGHLDLERNVLVTGRQQADPRFPQFLVYSAPEYGMAWQFDRERTRRVNGMS